MNSRSYHSSKVKQSIRAFKLKYAKKSFRDASLNKQLNAFTLCGGNIWLETELTRFVLRTWDCTPEINCFNNNPENNFAEFHSARTMLINLLGESKTYNSINLYCQKLSPRHIDPTSDFTDFDTCQWFSAKLAKDTINFCNRSRMLALTVIIKGGRVTDIHSGGKGIVCPAGMSFSDIKNTQNIIKYIENNSDMKCTDFREYRNTDAGAVATLATIIFQKLERKIPADVKTQVINLIKQGIKTKEISEITKAPTMVIAGIRASLTMAEKYGN